MALVLSSLISARNSFKFASPVEKLTSSVSSTNPFPPTHIWVTGFELSQFCVNGTNPSFPALLPVATLYSPIQYEWAVAPVHEVLDRCPWCLLGRMPGLLAGHASSQRQPCWPEPARLRIFPTCSTVQGKSKMERCYKFVWGPRTLLK